MEEPLAQTEFPALTADAPVGDKVRRLSRRRHLQTLASIVAGTVLAGARVGRALGQEGGEEPPYSEEAPPAAPVRMRPTGTVQFYTAIDQYNIPLDARGAQILLFKERFPELTLEIVPHEGWAKLVANILAGTPPDVFESGETRIPTIVINQWARDLTPWIQRDKVDLEDFYPALIDAMTFDGQLVALTDGFDTQVVHYNRNLFDRLGIKPPDGTSTYDQVLAAGQRLTRAEGDAPVWGLHHATGWSTMIDTVWAWGGDAFSEDGRRFVLNSPEATAALQWIADLWNRAKVAPAPSYTSQPGQSWTSLFSAGRIGMGLAAGLWVASDFLKASGLDWQVAPVPVGPKGRFNFLHLAIYPVSAQARNPEGGWEWLKYMTSREGIIVKGVQTIDLPSRQSLFDHPRLTGLAYLSERGVLQAWGDSTPTLRLARKVFNFVEAQAEISKALGPVWAGEKTAKQAMEEIVTPISTLIQRP